MSDLGSVLIGNPDDDARTPQWRMGVVTQASPLLVRVGSATTATPCTALASYAPLVGDAVSVLVVSGDRLVLGTVGAAGAWTDVTFSAGWSNFDADGAARQRRVQYRRVGDIVEMRGVAHPASPATGGTTGDVICVLPAGFCPSYVNLSFILNVDNQAKPFLVFFDGTIAPTGGTVVTNYVYLDGVRFSAT